MKFIYSESQNLYTNYLFSYQVFLIKEGNDSINQIYDMGFLPVRSIKNLYYLSRSCRVNLEEFQLSSENKRVLKKMENIKLQVFPVREFNYKKYDFLKKEYIGEIGLKRIFSPTGNYTDIFAYADSGVAVTLTTDSLLHYAHQFFVDKSFGMAGMTSIVNWAKEKSKKYVYLGTCFGKSSLYKTQFKGFEFFDGISWSNDLEKLKYMTEGDNLTKSNHLFQDEIYLERFYGENKLGGLIKKLQNAK